MLLCLLVASGHSPVDSSQVGIGVSPAAQHDAASHAPGNVYPHSSACSQRSSSTPSPGFAGLMARYYSMSGKVPSVLKDGARFKCVDLLRDVRHITHIELRRQFFDLINESLERCFRGWFV